jgi:hypothetical protein
LIPKLAVTAHIFIPMSLRILPDKDKNLEAGNSSIEIRLAGKCDRSSSTSKGGAISIVITIISVIAVIVVIIIAFIIIIIASAIVRISCIFAYRGKR